MRGRQQSIVITLSSPYGTHVEPSCTPHMGAILGPILVPYRLLAGLELRFSSPSDLVGFKSFSSLMTLVKIISIPWIAEN